MMNWRYHVVAVVAGIDIRRRHGSRCAGSVPILWRNTMSRHERLREALDSDRPSYGTTPGRTAGLTKKRALVTWHRPQVSASIFFLKIKNIRDGGSGPLLGSVQRRQQVARSAAEL